MTTITDPKHLAASLFAEGVTPGEVILANILAVEAMQRMHERVDDPARRVHVARAMTAILATALLAVETPTLPAVKGDAEERWKDYRGETADRRLLKVWMGVIGVAAVVGLVVWKLI